MAEWDRTVAIDQAGVFLGMKIATPILEQSRGTDIWGGMTAFTPMGRFGRPEDVRGRRSGVATDC